MVRCCNCILRVQRIQRHAVSDLSLQQKKILKESLALQLPVDAVICHACFLIVNESNSVPGRRFGHIDVCIGCGVSVLNKRHFNLEPRSSLLFVFEWSTRLLGYRNQVCRLCWVRRNRRVAQDVQRVTVEVPLPPEQPLSPIVTWEAPSTDHVVHLGSIILPNYKRHISQRQYLTYILFETDTSSQSPFDLILGYYCVVGNRTVGCCSHVMTIISFLGWARYQENITAPATYLDNILIKIEND